MKQRYLAEIEKQIEEANLIVVGLGEEWNISLEVMQSEDFKRIMRDLQERPDYKWILPYVYYNMTDEKLLRAYKKLFTMLEGKNYYVVSTAMNRGFVPYVREGRFVMPCGTEEYMLGDTLTASAEQAEFIQSLEAYIKGEILFDEIAFVRDNDGQAVPFNNIYAPSYKEEGYLPQWSKYMSWLQGTMNRKVCLLELGVGLQFPSVIRFPFEKMTYFNKKAVCFRVHKSLYQLTAEMAEKSVSVPVHAIELFNTEE